MTSIPFLTAPFLNSIPYLRHGFFGRKGGVSSGLFESLNTSRYKSDNEDNVTQNRALICQTMGFEADKLVVTRQVHGPDALLADESACHTTVDMDAQVTETPGILLSIQTADCVPILLADKTRPLVAAIHAGWKGTVAGVIEQTVELMRSKDAQHQNVVAAIGPCIWQVSYEVGEDVFEHAKSPQHFMPSERPNYFMFDLPGLVTQKLMNLGIEHINPSPANTYVLESEYFSFRRKTHQGDESTGGQLSVIGIMN